MLNLDALEAALAERYPDLAGDPELVRSVLVVEGLTFDCTVERLKLLFEEFGNVRRSCIVRDNIRGRSGVVLFHSATSCSAAETAQPASRWYRRVIRACKLDERNYQRSCRQLSNLIRVLNSVSPSIIEDPNFLNISVLVEGVAWGISPLDLQMLFDAQEAVLIADAEFCDRIGLLVLKGLDKRTIALAADPPIGYYCSCFPARATRLQILEALDHCAGLQTNTVLVRSLIPPQYIFDDLFKDLHFRCIFFSWPTASGVRGPFNLCSIADDELMVPMGFVHAVIIRREKDRSIGVLVCDIEHCTKYAYERVPHLLRRDLLMYDSSLFPLPGALGECRVNGLLPPFVTPAQYTGRLVLIKGLHRTSCDASEVSRFLEVVLKLKNIDGVIFHDGVVIVLTHTKEDAEALVQLPREAWFRAFAQDVCCMFDDTPTPIPQQTMAPAEINIRFNLWGLFNLSVLQRVEDIFKTLLDRCDAGNFRDFVRRLSGIAVMAQPNGELEGRNFSDRVVILMGNGVEDKREETIRSVLCRRYGSLHALVFYEKKSVGIVIFMSWISAARLLRDSNVLMPVGISCHRAPAIDDGFAHVISNWVLDRCQTFQGLTPPFQ